MVERSVAVGAGPRSIVLDERRKRALVVNTNVNTDGSVLHLPTAHASWLQRIPWLGERLPWLVRPSASADGRGSITVLDLSRLYR